MTELHKGFIDQKAIVRLLKSYYAVQIALINKNDTTYVLEELVSMNNPRLERGFGFVCSHAHDNP